jgi:hypothetical protein
MPKITPRQLHALRIVAAGRMSGSYVQHACRFSDGCETYTAPVMALSAKALVTIIRAGQRASVVVTARGRSLLQD